MTHDEMIAVIEHHKKGGLLESRPRHCGGGWSVVSIPIWDFSRFEYRKKKEPLVRWGIAWEDGYMSPNFFTERENAEAYAKGVRTCRVVKMVEAVE